MKGKIMTIFAALISVCCLASTPLPVGSAPQPVACPHFPDRVHAFVWRNWELTPVERMAAVIQAKPEDILRMGHAMGLPDPPTIGEEQWRRTSTTVIKHNWHLLPYDQLLTLLGWSSDQLAYTLREDDFLYVKLGMLKPQCDPLIYQSPDEKTLQREKDIAATVHIDHLGVPPFDFLKEFAGPAHISAPPHTGKSLFEPRYCFSYFGLTGDPFAVPSEEIYPDGYLAQLAAVGVDGVWLQGVLYTLAEFPWKPALSEGREKRLDNLRNLVARARKYGIGVYLYLNEPRAMPLAFYEDHPEYKGVVENDYAALCTSNPDVRHYLHDAIVSVCRAVPDLKGFFTITASENLTSCPSHFQDQQCPRCSKRPTGEVVAELINTFHEGIKDAGTSAELIVWDWVWPDTWPSAIIPLLPKDTAFMSVSEWSLPIQRGGIDLTVGEYSISAIGPGPRAVHNWDLARQAGLRTLAKVQVGTTWELGSVPYIPAVANVAEHVAHLRDAKVDGLMLGWTLGGYPSPNLEVAAEMGYVDDTGRGPMPETAMKTVANRRFGDIMGPKVVEAWKTWSHAFQAYPFLVSILYNGPQHCGPANLLWETPTGYHATMVGFPYDDVNGWRGDIPVDVFINQFKQMADGFGAGVDTLRHALREAEASLKSEQVMAVKRELDVAEACALHFRGAANQAKFVIIRDTLAKESATETPDVKAAERYIATLELILTDEADAAGRLLEIQCRDSRIGYEASNQYYYVVLDLVEKQLNCHDLLTRWLPAQRARLGVAQTVSSRK